MVIYLDFIYCQIYNMKIYNVLKSFCILETFCVSVSGWSTQKRKPIVLPLVETSFVWWALQIGLTIMVS